MLNYDPTGPAFEHGDRMTLSRLKLAIKYKQKKVDTLFFSSIYILRLKRPVRWKRGTYMEYFTLNANY